MNYIDKLIEDCFLAKQAIPTSEFDGADLSALGRIQSALYVIEEIGGDPEQTFFEFAHYKGRKERACAKLNAPSRVMYVGSSTTDVKKRIKQHIGKGHKGTYALHLSHWFRGKYKIVIKQYNVSAAVLQILEDDLSHRLQPAFGKLGGNNK